MTLVKLRKKDDPLERDVEKEIDDGGLSPLSPPDAYAPPGSDQAVSYEKMHPVLRELRDEHAAMVLELDAFEALLSQVKADGVQRTTEAGLARFFRCLDESVFPHNRKEEKHVFPLLDRRLIESGEHTKSDPPTTGIELIEGEHDEFLQLAAVVFNFLGLAGRLPDPESRTIVLGTAVQQAELLVEGLRLHIFREEHVIFSLAHKYITSEEFDRMQAPVPA